VGERLRCHYCGWSCPRPESCPRCGSTHLGEVGEGTQRVEEALAEALPSARIGRLDRDVVRSPRRLAEILGRFARHETDVLVGTQMIAKGHHFPRVTLVGVLSADTELRRPDFRAAERTFQLLTQVAGRSGRGERPGVVLIQAYRPEHPALRAALMQDYRVFAEQESAARTMLRYPPAAALANLIVRAGNPTRAMELALDLAEKIHAAGEGKVAVLGPTPAPLARIQGQWRVQLLLRARARGRLNDTLRRAIAGATGSDAAAPRWLTVDVDPLNLM
jgi:primosomal protein N' (replication factor Y)